MNIAGTLELISRIEHARSVDAVLELLRSVAEPYGFSGAGVSVLAQHNRRERLTYDQLGMPTDFIRRYVEKRYDRVSAVVRNMYETHEPFLWNQAPYDPLEEPLAHQCMMEGHDAGLKTGICVPVRTGESLVGWVLLTSDQVDISQTEQTGLHIVALAAQGRIRSLYEADDKLSNVRLTRREVEVLSWIAVGKSSEDVADILFLSSRTVEFHIQSAARKLDTSNRTHTVVEALRRGFIKL